MANVECVAQIISGRFGEILVRKKSGESLELGELLVAESKDSYTLFQVYDLKYGSQIPQESLELMSGMNLEGYGESLELMEPELRNYILASLKSVVTISRNVAKTPKKLPVFFSGLRMLKKEDLNFLTKPNRPLFLGNMRSGSRVLPIDVYLDGESVFTHHVLIPATTGRGKSNLVRIIAWSVLDEDYCSLLVLDPHDEYYGRNMKALKDHPKAREKLVYYTPNSAPPGAITLKINLESLKPQHFDGAIMFSEPQKEALYAYYNEYKEEWITKIILKEPVPVNFRDETLDVVVRRLLYNLDLKVNEDEITCTGIFDTQAGKTTADDILRSLESSKTVIIDTSTLHGAQEILVGSIIATKAFDTYRHYRQTGELRDKPVISVILEEAPRVIGKDALKAGGNIFSRIAREGRKFRVGLTAITQLPSLIPKEILANMNTKIILGIEMAEERRSVIECASQDLSTDERNIASLDKGEALVTSNFTKFAMPIYVPFFDEYIKDKVKKPGVKKDFSGIL
ncbi:MAG: ATP-binding protein [archaeon]